MKKKFYIIFSLVLICVIVVCAYFIFSLKNNSENIGQQRVQNNLNAPIEIPDEGIVKFDEAKDYDKPVIVMFYVDWCGYCRRFMPIFGQMAKKYEKDFTFAVVNCDLLINENLVKKYHVAALPSLYIVDKKLNHTFTMNMASSSDVKIFEEEADNFIKLKKKINLK